MSFADKYKRTQQMTDAELSQARQEARDAMKPMFDKLTRSERLNSGEKQLFDECNDFITECEGAQKARAAYGPGYSGRAGSDVPVKGEPNEQLRPGQTMRSWVHAAAANGVSMTSQDGVTRKVETRDREFLNDYFGGLTGVSQNRFATRALGEGTAGGAINPITWSADVIDYLYPQTILGQVGATRVPMAAQQVSVPQLTGVPSPTWIAENGSVSLDGGAAFSKLLLDASGGFKDIIAISLELMQDAYVEGTLSDYLAQQVAKRMALAVDAAAFYGIASNAGNPGLSNETGVVLRKYAGHTGTTGAAPVDTQELSVMAEATRNANAVPNAFVCNPSYAGTLSRLNASTYAKYWDIPADAQELWNNRVVSTQIPVTETDPATGTVPAQTGGSYTSVYLGDWSRYLLGVRLDLTMQVLRERYIDSGQVGLFGFARFSTRASHPETFVRSYGATVV